MPADNNPISEGSELEAGELLSERERKSSQRAFIVMATLLSVSARFLTPSGVLGMYVKQLGLTAEDVGRLVAQAAPFGVVGLTWAGLAVKVGKKRMLRWGIWSTGLVLMFLLILLPVKTNWGTGAVMAVAFGLLAGQRVLESLVSIPWFPLIKDITQESRRGAFLGRMRMIWGGIALLSMILVARLVGEQAPMGMLIALLMVAGLLYWLMLWPLRHVVERRTETRPQAVGWPEFWREVRRNRLYVRCVLIEGLSWLMWNMFLIFQYYFLTESLRWSDSFAADLLWLNLLGLAATNVFWGAAADCLGDRAVAQLGFVVLVASTLCWVAASDDQVRSGILLVAGVIGMGIARAATQMSLTRVFLNGIPERLAPSLLAARKTVLILTMMVAGGLGSFVLGRLEGWCWPGRSMWFWLDGYKVLFMAGIGVPLISIWLSRKLPTVPGGTPWTVLATMFNRPVQTIWIVSQIDSPLPEDGRLDLVRRLSQTPSRLANDSLVQGLRDASYDVRLASVNALASRGEPLACEALMAVLDEGELDIQPEAAWALGELGDERAIPVLLKALRGGSELLRGRAARSLGKLEAEEAIPILKEMLSSESDSFVRRSAAIALSRLNVRESLEAICQRFRMAQTRLAQRELALTLANLVHGGDLYYRIRKHGVQDMGAVLSGEVDKALAKESAGREVRGRFSEMIESLKRDDLKGIRSLASRAISEGLLEKPVGSAGELADYLLSSRPSQPWTEEHAALLIFLLLQERRSHRA